MVKKFEVVAVTTDGAKIKDTITASNEDKARELFFIVTPNIAEIKEVTLLIDYDKVLAEKYFKRFKDKVNSMSLEEFQSFDNLLFRTFNFINCVEAMDIPEINQLQEEPREYNCNVTSKEVMDKCNELINLDVE